MGGNGALLQESEKGQSAGGAVEVAACREPLPCGLVLKPHTPTMEFATNRVGAASMQ